MASNGPGRRRVSDDVSPHRTGGANACCAFPVNETPMQCARCGEINPAEAVSCHACLAVLNSSGVLQGLERPWRPAWDAIGAVAGRVLAVAAMLAVGGFGVYLHNERYRYRPPPAEPDVSGTPYAMSAAELGSRKVGERGKFEPETGCYLGAFVMNDANINGSMAEWVRQTGKQHASYLRYVGYGRDFPSAWVAEVRAVGASPNLALEPNGGLDQVRDDEYLRRFAHSAARSGGPVFLRFASEMNGDWTVYHGNPKAYREAFRLVSRVMAEEAPNVAMVWTPYCMPDWEIDRYYPGDDAVDWVGVNIYSVHHQNNRLDRPVEWQDPTTLLSPVYRRYSKRKPIQISEYAATHHCGACGEQLDGWARSKMKRLYTSLPKRFPRVKSVYWFSWDTLTHQAADNEYSITADPNLMAYYANLVAADHFLGSMTSAPTPDVAAASLARPLSTQ